MGRDNKSKVIAIIALVIAVTGLSIGFAMYSSVLTINTNAMLTPDSKDFKVEFQEGTAVSPTGAASVTLSSNSDNQVVVSDVVAKISKPGDVVTILVPIKNTGNYDAYLKSVNFTPATGDKCTPLVAQEDLSSVSSTNVNAVCDDISMKILVGSLSFTSSTVLTSEHKLLRGKSEMCAIIITYDSNSTVVAQNDMKINFGKIELNFSSSN